LDRIVGIPLVALFRVAPRRPRPDPASISRIGILKTAAIGDTLLLAGVLAAIRRQYPKAALVLITGDDNAPAAALLRHVLDDHVTIRPREPVASLRTIRGLRLDVLLECGPWPRLDALLATLSSARFRVGFRTRGQARHFGFDAVVDHSSMIHQFENLQNLAMAIGVTAFEPPSLRPPGILPRSRLRDRPVAVFHPWSGGYMGHVKQWAEERWVELAHSLYVARRMHVLVSGGPGDADKSRALANRIAAAGGAGHSIAGDFTLAELADVFASSDVVVSVNTGVMHLAALLGVPTVSLEGPAAAHRWGPVGPRVRSVASTVPGSGYLDLGFEYDGHRLDAMDGVSVSATLGAIDELLG